MIYLVYAGWPTLVNAILLDVIDPVDGRIPKTKKCLISSIKLAFFPLMLLKVVMLEWLPHMTYL